MAKTEGTRFIGKQPGQIQGFFQGLKEKTPVFQGIPGLGQKFPKFKEFKDFQVVYKLWIS